VEDGRVRFRGPQRTRPPEGEGIMRLTKPEKKALLDLLEWATAYHMEEIEQWIDPREGLGFTVGGDNILRVRDKLRAEVQFTDDERLERDNTAHDWERDRLEH
jgi:hypothetical protein